MKQLKKLKPAFWTHRDIAGGHTNTGFNFARKWKLIVLFTSIMALSPLFAMTLVDFSLTRRIIEDEVEKNILNNLTAAAISISFSKNLEKSALDYISQVETGEENDIFLINKKGTLLTSSFYYGKPGTLNVLDLSLLNKNSGIKKQLTSKREKILTGYIKLPDSSLILLLARSEKSLTDLWFKPRIKLVWYLTVSIIIILLSIMGMATYLISRIHTADKKRIEALHHAEYSDKLASIGRLSSGVAHEINNPLAIISQKTGLIVDLLSLKEELAEDKRLITLANDVLETVDRCSTITRRLLDFAQHMEPSIEIVDIKQVVGKVIALLEKEAERKHITISVDTQNTISGFECDKGSLLQIFLNLFNNSFTAMKDGGRLEISVKLDKNKKVNIIVSDDGKGIAKEDINKIFEPFYSSKGDHWGTGLGLAITYGLIKELGGDIMVKSNIDKGTRFTLILPLKAETKQDMHIPSNIVSH